MRGQVTPKFVVPGRHNKFLASLQGGLDGLGQAGAATWAGLLYSIAVPKEIMVTRVFQVAPAPARSHLPGTSLMLSLAPRACRCSLVASAASAASRHAMLPRCYELVVLPLLPPPGPALLLHVLSSYIRSAPRACGAHAHGRARGTGRADGIWVDLGSGASQDARRHGPAVLQPRRPPLAV